MRHGSMSNALSDPCKVNDLTSGRRVSTYRFTKSRSKGAFMSVMRYRYIALVSKVSDVESRVLVVQVKQY